MSGVHPTVPVIAEPDGPEFYIPLTPSPEARKRNARILGETARRLADEHGSGDLPRGLPEEPEDG